APDPGGAAARAVVVLLRVSAEHRRRTGEHGGVPAAVSRLTRTERRQGARRTRGPLDRGTRRCAHVAAPGRPCAARKREPPRRRRLICREKAAIRAVADTNYDARLTSESKCGS